MADSPRGVCKLDILFNGNEVLAARDSRRNCLGVVVLSPDVDEVTATADLEALLDDKDPQAPALTLVDIAF